MSKETFLFLCSQLRQYIKRTDTKFRKFISVEKRLAVTLLCLATPCECRSISHLFGIGHSTVCEIVYDTCRVIIENLLSQYIKFPTGAQLDNIVAGFEQYIKFPTGAQLDNIVAGFEQQWEYHNAPEQLMELTFLFVHHCLIIPDYYNRKGYYSINMQAVVDHQYRFLDVYIGWPSSVHDARVFAHSSLYNKGVAGTLLPSKERIIHGVKEPLFIVGDAAYPLLSWLMKPYPQSLATSTDKMTYNYRLSRAHIVVENAFG